MNKNNLVVCLESGRHSYAMNATASEFLLISQFKLKTVLHRCLIKFGYSVATLIFVAILFAGAVFLGKCRCIPTKQWNCAVNKRCERRIFQKQGQCTCFLTTSLINNLMYNFRSHLMSFCFGSFVIIRN